MATNSGQQYEFTYFGSLLPTLSTGVGRNNAQTSSTLRRQRINRPGCGRRRGRVVFLGLGRGRGSLYRRQAALFLLHGVARQDWWGMLVRDDSATSAPRLAHVERDGRVMRWVER